VGHKIAVVPIAKGFRNDVLPFNIDNDSFPVLRNAYEWRKRIRRKRGTRQLGRLRRYIGSTDGAGNASVTIFPVPLNAAVSQFVIGTNIFTDPGGASPVTLLTNGPGTGSLDRSTGILTIIGSQPSTPILFYPGTPVLGLEDVDLSPGTFPGTLAFDSHYSYNINTTFPYTIFDVSFYKNPPVDATNLPGYSPKATWTSTTWNGQNYQQFWSANYQGAFWVTNGINIPFSPTNVGMQYKNVGAGGAVVVSATDVDFTTTNSHPFVAGDFIFVNEFTGINGLNFQSGYVLLAPAPTATTFRARFPIATISGGPGSNGIIQALTTNCQPDISSTVATTIKDCLRWYDGAPVTSSSPPVFTLGSGWVNFAPPLTSGPSLDFFISDLPAGQYYLVGARMIVPFKDRLLFVGPVVQTSALGSQRYLQDTVIYSENGTPFYTASFPYSTVNPSPSLVVTYRPILVPTDQTSLPESFWEDVTGFGGFIQAGYSQPIVTVSSNQDVLIMGFSNKKARFVYTGNDIVPFNFYIINSEYGSDSTFSSINMDRGMVDIGSRGFTLTSQVESQRIDLEIPDEVFKFSLLNNAKERVCAQRDFINEWIYFTYSSSDSPSLYVFPNQTLFYNYREETWAVFRETYTTYGQFRRVSGQTWDDLTDFTWDEWADLWDSGEQTLLQPEVIAGNAQGFVMFRSEGTGEDPSSYISNISTNTITSPAHGLDQGDYIIIRGALGTVGAQINGNIFSIAHPTVDTFELNPPITAGTYTGNGVFTRLYIPFIQTRQFPMAWEMGRKTRIGAQQYLLSTTTNGQITLLIFLSQNSDNSYNSGSIIPNPSSTNNSLIYSTVLFTCPEPNNLQMLAASSQNQIWHRINTSLIGDTVQLGFTLSDEQMRDTTMSNQMVEIELHSFIIDISPSQLLA